MENNDDTSRGCFDWDNYNNEFYNWIKNLSKIRKLNVLKNGEFNILFSECGKFVFERYNNNEHLVVIVNLTNSPLIVNLNGNFKSYFTNQEINEYVSRENTIEIFIEKNN
jgi:glycosidase